MIETNEHGVPQYPKADARRLFVLLASIDKLPRPTITTLASYTGHNKGSIDTDVVKLIEQFGVQIIRSEAVYRIESWGEILNKKGVKKSLQG